MSNDIIIDTLDTLIELLQRSGGVLLPSHRGEAERIARAAWGGDRPYVAKVGESQQLAISQRDRSIMRDRQRGVHAPVLARRYGLSLRRVQEILAQSRQASGPAKPPSAPASAAPGAAD
jgi:predicted ATPase